MPLGETGSCSFVNTAYDVGPASTGRNSGILSDDLSQFHDVHQLRSFPPQDVRDHPQRDPAGRGRVHNLAVWED